MQITFFTRTFRNGQHNLHCDVVHITTKWVFCLTLDCNGVFAIKAYSVIAEQNELKQVKDCQTNKQTNRNRTIVKSQSRDLLKYLYRLAFFYIVSSAP